MCLSRTCFRSPSIFPLSWLEHWALSICTSSHTHTHVKWHYFFCRSFAAASIVSRLPLQSTVRDPFALIVYNTVLPYLSCIVDLCWYDFVYLILCCCILVMFHSPYACTTQPSGSGFVYEQIVFVFSHFCRLCQRQNTAHMRLQNCATAQKIKDDETKPNSINNHNEITAYSEIQLPTPTHCYLLFAEIV